jgi:hypothetical protein
MVDTLSVGEFLDLASQAGFVVEVVQGLGADRFIRSFIQ